MRMTWNLGVVKLKFRVEDGGYELHRKVPYDYDSEYQDIYMRIAVALIEGDINIHEALQYQTEAKKGLHTAKSGLFLRDFPGRLILYPLEAGTCAVIFFSGNWIDAAIAALCGFAAGLVEYALVSFGGPAARSLIDVFVGLSTGIIGGLFVNYVNEGICISSVFLGVLYWFFYGTAFVIGLLEIISGELETGVTRFIAVSVKTFVLCLGASLGLLISSNTNAAEIWLGQNEFCGSIIEDKWWRIPLYLACSATTLGQYRLPLVQYWRGLVVQLVAYEVQYQSFQYYSAFHTTDNIDSAISNVLGAAAGVISACLLSSILNVFRGFYNAKLLQNGQESSQSLFGKLCFKFMRLGVRIGACLRVGRRSDLYKLSLEKKLRHQHREVKDPTNSRQEISIDTKEENLILETIVGSQAFNIWAILMPAVYQLVPGSIIARLWFSSIFPPPENASNTDVSSVFSNLMVISTSLAIGLIFGFALVQSFNSIASRMFKFDSSFERMQSRLGGMYCAPGDKDDDPESVRTMDSDISMRMDGNTAPANDSNNGRGDYSSVKNESMDVDGTPSSFGGSPISSPASPTGNGKNDNAFFPVQMDKNANEKDLLA